MIISQLIIKNNKRAPALLWGNLDEPGRLNKPAQEEVIQDPFPEHIADHPEAIRSYAFSYDTEEHLAYFYVVPDVTIRKNKDAAVAKLRAELEEEFPDIVFNIDTSVEM